MKTVARWAIIIAAIAGAELYFGVDDTGARVALALLIWACLSIPVGLAFGQFCKVGGMDSFYDELKDRARDLRPGDDNADD